VTRALAAAGLAPSADCQVDSEDMDTMPGRYKAKVPKDSVLADSP